MKKLKSFLIFVLLLMISPIGFAQNTVEEIQPLDLIKEVGPQNIVPNFSINPAQMENIPNHSNNIFIDQIGSKNSIMVKTTTQSSVLDLVQKGDNNTLKLNFSAMTAAETIRQQGDNHYLAAFGKTPSLNLERTINQTGYGQNLTIHGSNSLSEKMQLNMKGSSSTIIIRNFN